MKTKKFFRLTAFILTAIMALSGITVSADAPVEKRDDIQVPAVLLEEYSLFPQNFTTVDIRSYVNRGFDDEAAGDGLGGWTDQGAVNDMSCYTDRGRVTYQGIPFDIIEPNDNGGKSALIMRGQNEAGLPTEVEISIDATFKGAYFLHTAPWLSAKEDVGEYEFVYEDGSRVITSVSGEEEIFNWWNTYRSDYATIAWSANNNSSLVSLGIFPVDNPYPSKKVKSIIVKSIGTGPYLCLVAITLTDAGPYRPYEKVKNIGNPDTSKWFSYQFPDYPDEIKGTPIDMSWIQDAPAGKHGKIVAKGEELYFEDGTRAQFWGTNFTGSGIFPSYKNSEMAADRLAQQGFNIVRFHIMKNGDVETIAGTTLVSSTARRRNMLSEDHMDKFCYLIGALKKRGIYHIMDIESYGTLLKDENIKNIGTFSDMTSGPGWFDPEMYEIQSRYTDQFLNYYNKYTGYKIGEDPALVMASQANERSLFMSKETNWEAYYPYYQELYNEWLREKYPTREALYQAWYQPQNPNPGLREGEDQFEGTVEVFADLGMRKMNDRRYEDNMRFVNHVTEEYMRSRTAEIRAMGDMDMLILGSTAFTSGTADGGNNYTQAHATDLYTHQSYLFLAQGNGEHLAPGTKISTPYSMLTTNIMQPVNYLGTSQVYGKPFFVTEWDAGALNPYYSELYVTMPALASLHDWHCYQFGYGFPHFTKKQGLVEEERFIWSTHPLLERSVQSFVHAAGLMVLRGDLKEADAGYVWKRYQNDEMFKRENQSANQDASLTLVGKTGKAFDKVAYDPEYNDNRVLKLAKYGNKTGIYAAITGEIMTDTNKGIFKINTDRTQAVSGALNLEDVELNDVIFDIDNNFASIYFQSLSYDPINTADKLLVSVLGDSRNKGQVMTEDGTTVVDAGTGPIQCEPIEGRITIKSYDDFEVYVLDTSGHRVGKVAVTKTEEGYAQFEMDYTHKAFYYEIVRTKKSSKGLVDKKVTFLTDEMLADCFDDVSEENKDKIERIYLEGIMKPTGDRAFSPNMNITRGDFVKLLMTEFGLAAQCDDMFADVTEDNVNYSAIAAAKEYFIISGDENGNFNPDGILSKQDMLVMTRKTIEQSMKYRNEIRSTNNTDTARVAHYADESVNYMLKYGFIEPENDYYAPATREDVAVLLYNIIWE